jgi:hypothetical protein
MLHFKLGGLALLAVFAVALSGPAFAADATVTPAPVAKHAKVVAPPAGAHATIVPPRVAYGCKRVWRCDDQVCEWRRGCWGIYGYVESPT